MGSTSAPDHLIEDPATWLGHLLLVSLLFMLNAHLFFTLNTGMDLYGFYTLDPVAAYPLPAVLSTLLNVALAAVAYVFYRWLRRRRAWFTGGLWSPFTRGAVLSAAPVALAYGPGVALTSTGGKPTLIAVAGLIAGSLCVSHALRDPETKFDPVLARHWFIGTIAAILVFLVLALSAMLVLHLTELPLPTGNLLWKWNFEWSDLGYPAEQFQQRQREALVGFTLTGAGFMLTVLGGSMLGAILRHTREPQGDAELPRVPAWGRTVLDRLGWSPASNPAESKYVAVFNGLEVGITEGQYASLIAGGDGLLDGVDLLVDKSFVNVRLRDGRSWHNMNFRAGRKTARRSGPFALLCIYARYPGKRFSNSELRALLETELSNHISMNVTDFINQLRGKEPSVPLAKDAGETYLSEALKVCLLERRDGHFSTPPDRGYRPTLH